MKAEDLRGGGDLTENLQCKANHELRTLVNGLAGLPMYGDVATFIREWIIYGVLHHMKMAKQYQDVFGISTDTVDTVDLSDTWNKIRGSTK